MGPRATGGAADGDGVSLGKTGYRNVAYLFQENVETFFYKYIFLDVVLACTWAFLNILMVSARTFD